MRQTIFRPREVIHRPGAALARPQIPCASLFRETVMKQAIPLIFAIICILLYSCEKKDPGAVALSVNFTWEDYAPCDMGLPQMTIGGIPANTKFLKVRMYDHDFGFDHGEVKIKYAGSGTITRGSYKEITGPCPPPNSSGRYKITVKALDANNMVVGMGSKERYFPVTE